MSRTRRNFTRSYGDRTYRKLFVIATEGTNTERQYFELFNHLDAIIHVKCLPTKQSDSPTSLLKKMDLHLRTEELKSTDEAWLVIDRDHWLEIHLDRLVEWSRTHTNRHLALSNPKFEYWLLLHFDEGNHVKSSSDVMIRLKRHLPAYDKSIEPAWFTVERVKQAIVNAKKRDSPPCADWPRNQGCTTVYRLVEQLLKS
jgi:hypothetical protein